MPSSLLIIPDHALHGTPEADLYEAGAKVRCGLRKLLSAIDEAAPNGRDYYMQPDEALRRAIAERDLLRQAVCAVDADVLGSMDPDGAAADSAVAVLAPSQARPTVLPVVHLNGTSGEELRRTARDVFTRAQEVEEAFRACVPNLRDYADTDRWEAAREQHAARVRVIRSVGQYFLLLAMDLTSPVRPVAAGA